MLIHDARDLARRLAAAEAARESIEETSSLKEMANELEALQQRIHIAQQRSQTLRGAGVPLAIVEGREIVGKNIAGVLKPFDGDRKSATLKRASRWSKLVSSLEAYLQAIEARRQADWKHYFANALFAGDSPEAVEARLAPTPENMRQLAEYRVVFAHFNRFRSALPLTELQISEVKGWSAELAEIEKSFETNLPDAVRDFFSATASNTGAPLRLFNKEVEGWLMEHKLMDNYVVRARYQ